MSPGSQDITVLFLSLGVLLAAARLLGEIALRLGQPSFVGELLAGILLGPTVLGRLAPEWSMALFATTGTRAAAWDSLTMLSIALFLLVAGMQVPLSTIWRQGTTWLALAGFVVPFSIALIAASLAPHLLGCERDANAQLFAAFFATAMAVSAPAVIIKTFVELNLYRSDMGRLVVAAALFNNLAGWLVFAIILGLLGSQRTGSVDVLATISLTLLFAGGMLTVGRWAVNRLLPWVQAHTSWPGGVLGFAVALSLFVAGSAAWLGIHAIFGAFLVGIAIGDSAHVRAQTRRTILDFISFIFAPLLFASVGLRIDFAAKFDPLVIGSILTIACAGKLVGCGLAARLAGQKWPASCALGLAMNARGAMTVVFGYLALEHGLIRQRMLVAIVVTAVLTSLISEPAIQRLLRRRRSGAFTDFLPTRGFVPHLVADDRWEAMERLATALVANEDSTFTADSAMWGGTVRVAWAGPKQEVAICLATIDTRSPPLVAVGIASGGVPFGALAVTPADIVILVITPEADAELEWVLEEDIVRAFASERTIHEARAARNATEFLAALRTGDKPSADEQPAEILVA